MVRQFALNKDLNLFYLRLSEAVRVDGDFVCELLNLKKAGIPDLEDLKDIYRETFYDLDDSNGTEIIIAHHERLSRWLSVFYSPSFIETLRGQKKIGRVVNEEYPASRTGRGGLSHVRLYP